MCTSVFLFSLRVVYEICSLGICPLPTPGLIFHPFVLLMWIFSLHLLPVSSQLWGGDGCSPLTFTQVKSRGS